MTTKQFIYGQFLVSFITLSFLFMTSCENISSKESQENTATEKVVTKKKPGMDLHAAVFMGNIKALKEHIAYGTNLNTKDAYGSTPLNIASTFGKTDIALLLIESGANINELNADGGTALHTAAFFCRTEIVKALLKAGADKNIRNQYQSTAFESVSANWEDVKPIYEQFARDLGPLGLRLDLERIEKTRPEIAELLK